MEKEAEEDEKVLALGLGRFQRRMLVAVTSFADSLLDYALAIAKPASLPTSSWLQELALTLYTRWGSCNSHSTKSFDFMLLARVLQEACSPGLRLPMISFYSTV